MEEHWNMVQIRYKKNVRFYVNELMSSNAVIACNRVEWNFNYR